MRYALKFGYHGKNFSGYARQPNLRTVEGEIFKALKKIIMIIDEKDANIQSASRTDKGVSAIGNVIAIDTDFRKNEMIQALNAHLEDVWFYGFAEVKENFNPRHAKQRWYRYYLLDKGSDQNKIEKIAEIFVGKHDFSNFARLEEGKNPQRIIDSIKISRDKEFIILDFRANNFLWNMVRRIVKAIIDTSCDKISQDDILKALEGKEIVDFGIVPSDYLILMDVSYDFQFEIDKMKLSLLKEKLEKGFNKSQINLKIYQHMLDMVK